MELFIILIIGLTLPYLLYGWLYGASLVKRLYEKEFKSERGLLQEYQKLSSEERMEFDLKRKEEKPKKSEWISPLSPTEVNISHKAAVKEGILETSPAGKWEDQKDQESSKPAIVG